MIGPMLDQIFLGTFVTLASLITAATLWWSLTHSIEVLDDWMRRPPRPLKSIAVIAMVTVWSMLIMTVGVWLWAFVFIHLDIFPSLEEAVYYSLVAYTTLGLGDVVVPVEWRLLGGMTGANGFLMFGLLTAMLTDALRHIRRIQHDLTD